MEVLAACHLHSSWSYDGSWSLEALASEFGARGYRILMMTEHDRGFDATRYADFRSACARASSPEMFVMPGIEYSDAQNRVHVLVWGAIPFFGEALPTGTLLEEVASHGGVAVLAHPARKNAGDSVPPEWTHKLLAIELWNRKYDGWAMSRTAPVLLGASNCVPFVGLDFHTHKQMFPLGMALDIHGDVSEKSVLDALHARRCAARAFGLALDDRRLQKKLQVLAIAEKGRRNAAALKRYSARRLSAFR